MKVLFGIYCLSLIGLIAVSRGETPIGATILWVLLALWIATLSSMLLDARWFRWVALLALMPVLAALVFQLGRRIVFIAVNGGMDDASSGFGSPVAFLIGWIAELVIFIPGLAFFAWLWRMGRHRVSASS